MNPVYVKLNMGRNLQKISKYLKIDNNECILVDPFKNKISKVKHLEDYLIHYNLVMKKNMIIIITKY